MSSPTTKRQPSFIDPNRLYALRGFQIDADITPTRMREARLQGVKPTMLKIGKRVFIRGADAIDYLERLAELSAPK
ncbi:hypothetical protein [Lacipirellula limnantheis]|uniref:DNA-binding protein n=1 Tax=Lacipirellula limnantheis TaxID=2528024 RepID=A0A517U3J8_9BACT|nr:hypothetical protein [Lacipirellula limnantheis]QDT75202.1 hypothetical protein I41_44120 [Lacipirellula limnantheis]